MSNYQQELKTRPMFFGPPVGIQRYDVQKYKYFEDMTKQQLSYFWLPQEINLVKDNGDFKRCNEAQKRIFTLNLKYQILLDSIQSQGISTAFVPYCSLPELESALLTWSQFECIHSRSYTYIIKNLYQDPSQVFDEILEDQSIINRAKSSQKYYDKHIKNPTKESLLLAMVNVFILEGIRFYTSFASTFAFAESQILEGSAKIVSLIARDENLHMALSSYIINKWKKDEMDMKEIIDDNRKVIKEMMDTAVEEEYEWAQYLFKQGSLIGLNAELCQQYIMWLATDRLKKIGISKSYGVDKNPLPWMNNWLNSKNVQVAPQETEISSYLVGGIKQDRLELSNFSL